MKIFYFIVSFAFSFVNGSEIDALTLDSDSVDINEHRQNRRFEFVQLLQ